MPKSVLTKLEENSKLYLLQNNKEYGEQLASFGMNLLQLEQLRLKQVRGAVKYVPCNQDPSFKIPENEADYIVVFNIIVDMFDSVTGENRGYEKCVKYNSASYFNMLKHNLLPKGTVELVHMPKSIEIQEQNLQENEKRQEELKQLSIKAKLKRQEKQLESRLSSIKNQLR